MTIAEQVVEAVTKVDDPWGMDTISVLPQELRAALTHEAHEKGVELRWEMRESRVFRATDGSYVRLMWSRGLTEEQEAEPHHAAEVVEPVQVTVTQYVTKKLAD